MGDLNDLICLLPIVRMLVETLRMKIVLRVRSTGRQTIDSVFSLAFEFFGVSVFGD